VWSTGARSTLTVINPTPASNGIWQDGGTLAEQPNVSWIAFINKFTSQSHRTDDQGHPLP